MHLWNLFLLMCLLGSTPTKYDTKEKKFNETKKKKRWEEDMRKRKKDMEKWKKRERNLRVNLVPGKFEYSQFQDQISTQMEFGCPQIHNICITTSLYNL